MATETRWSYLKKVIAYAREHAEETGETVAAHMVGEIQKEMTEIEMDIPEAAPAATETHSACKNESGQHQWVAVEHIVEECCICQVRRFLDGLTSLDPTDRTLREAL